MLGYICYISNISKEFTIIFGSINVYFAIFNFYTKFIGIFAGPLILYIFLFLFR